MRAMLTARLFCCATVLNFAGWVSGRPALAQDSGHSHEHAMERLGKVEFAVSCNPAAQAKFNYAMALYHSFAWPAAERAFAAVAAADPACGMAQWGKAMTLLGNTFQWPANLPAQLLNDVVAALDGAKIAGLGTQREQDYVAALGAFARDHATVPHPVRMQAYDTAMAALAARYPEDKEAAVLSALATSTNFNPTDKAYTNQLKAASILQPMFLSDPDHPGVAHYLIHSYDYPAIASRGVDAARKYATIAPDAAHAQHMPSHIFTRLGYWRESISANREAVRVAGDATTDGHHGSDYMVYAHLQLAQDGAARGAMDASLAMKPIDGFPAAFAYAAMPARLALERGDWATAAAMPLRPAADAYPWRKYPQAEAVNAFARGVGAARAGNGAAALEQRARLIALRDAAKELKLTYWVEQIDIQAALVGALAMCAEAKTSECIEALRPAAAREDATEKHVVTPGPIVPARELLAETLLAQNRPAEALAEYNAVMAKEPNRFRAVAGAMEAARAAGDAAKARGLAAELVRLGGEADAPREALVQAKQLAGG